MLEIPMHINLLKALSESVILSEFSLFIIDFHNWRLGYDQSLHISNVYLTSNNTQPPQPPAHCYPIKSYYVPMLKIFNSDIRFILE